MGIYIGLVHIKYVWVRVDKYKNKDSTYVYLDGTELEGAAAPISTVQWLGRRQQQVVLEWWTITIGGENGFLICNVSDFSHVW